MKNWLKFLRNTNSIQEPELDNEVTDLLFVYGTLMRGFGREHFLESPQKSRYLGEGRVQGLLYDVGEFPALVPLPQDSGEEAWVTGEVFFLEQPDSVLNTLDIIEGVNHHYPERGLFRRETWPVEFQGETRLMWLYVYNQPVDDLRRITSGDYRTYCRDGANFAL